ncbi:MAG TPA: TonB family protein [Spirochaetes bacterium]|nr:TonB family protein [Spirochaetota bacterium]
MTRAGNQDRKRVFISVIFALLVHGAVFFIIQYLLPMKKEDVPDYSGPIEITITREPREFTGEIESEEELVRAEPEAVVEHDEDESSLDEEPFFEDNTYEDYTSTVDKPPAPAVTVRDTDTIKYPVTESIKSESLPFFKSTSAFEKPAAFDQKAVSRVEDKAVNPDLAEVAPVRGMTPEDIPEENIYAPVDPEETLAPVQEKPEKKLLFEPLAELEPDTLAFDMDQLDEAIEYGKDDSRIPQKTEPYTDPGSVSGTNTSAKPAGERNDVLSIESSLIEWDKDGRKRVQIFPGPKSDIPLWVKKEGLDLQIAVSFAVTPGGYTTSVTVEESSGYPDVDAAVLETVRKMSFNPVSGSENVTGTIRYIISTK